MSIDPLRIRSLNDAPHKPNADFVLYWMTASRRPRYNFSLQRAVTLAREYGKPLVILEALRVGYRWANRRHHQFIMDGMAANAAYFKKKPACYYPYVETSPVAGKGLLTALSKRACAIVTDDYPCFFLPRMLTSAARQVAVRLEAVDGNGLLPMRAAPKPFARAVDLRRFLQKQLPHHLDKFPLADPLLRRRLPAYELPKSIVKRWPMATHAQLSDHNLLDELPIDQTVHEVEETGGHQQAGACLQRFVSRGLSRYQERSHPDEDVASELSPYLHYGHISTYEMFIAIAERERWSMEMLAPKATGSRAGWWGMSEAAEGFLDQMITWREIGFNGCHFMPDYDKFESLPGWAQKTMAEHAADPRPYLYSLAQLEQADTHDDIWNAAQRQLVQQGRMANYLRMLWGKKIYHWTESPRAALDIMIELNNKYALDGRDPNSYSGIFWVLGRYDRAWGPEREIFGKIRYMTSDSTRRKLRLRNYLQKWGPQSAQQPTLF